MANLVEQIYLDITAYSETSIPLTTETSNPLTRTNDSHLDLILYPYYANPREVKNWDVPLSVSKLVEMANGSWDVTLFKVSLSRSSVAELESGMMRRRFDSFGILTDWLIDLSIHRRNQHSQAHSGISRSRAQTRSLLHPTSLVRQSLFHPSLKLTGFEADFTQR